MTNNLKGIRKGLCAFAKRCKEFKYTDSALITFLITGAISSVSDNVFSAEINNSIENEKKIISTSIKDFNVLIKEARKQTSEKDKSRTYTTYGTRRPCGKIILEHLAIWN